MKNRPVPLQSSKTLLTGLLFVLISLNLSAQTVTNYAFVASTGTFTALTSPTNPSLTAGVPDDGYFNNIPIGFDFWYMGTRYTTISASTNGWLTLGANLTADVLLNNLNNGTAQRPVIAPLWDDLDVQAASNVSYKVTGSAPNRTFTIQYLNTQWQYNATGNTVSFQVNLFESTGKIEFIYRPETGTLSTPTASIGITAAATGSGNFLSVDDAGTSVSSLTEVNNVATKPVSGRKYAFTPPVPTAPGSFTFSSVGTTSMTLNWSDLSSNETGFVVYKSTDGGTTYNFVSQTAAGVTSSAQSGLTASTTYFWKVYAVSEGGLSTELSGSQATTTPTVTWHNSGWLYRKAITIDYTKVGTGPHTNFPILINRADTDLQSKAQADGDDILFTSADGSTKLDHQIESYTSGTGTIVAWVEIPSLSSTANTVIYMYYGNAAAGSQQNVTGTWDASFKGVWHLNSAFTDATSNANNGTNTGTIAATGKISGGSGFVRSNGTDYITVAGKMGSPSSFTLSAWTNLTTIDVNAAEIISIADNSLLRYDGANGKTNGVSYNGSSWNTITSSTNYASGWHYVAYTFDDVGNVQQVYVDGQPDGSATNVTTSPSYTGGTNTFIGMHGNGNVNMDFDGTIDEARVSSASRSAGWILTEYNNQNSPSTFYSVGTEVITKTFTGTGSFSDPTKWTGGTLPIAGENIIIDGACTVDNNVGTDNVAYGTLIIGTATGRTLSWAASGTNRLNVSNVSAGAGFSTLDMTSGGTLIIRGAWTSTNLTYTRGTGTIEVQSAITLPAAYTNYTNLTINSAGTVTIGVNNTVVNGSLNVTTGTLQLGTLNLTSGDLLGSGTIASSGGTPTLTVGSLNTSTTFSGVIGTGAIAFTKNGTGVLTLSGTNTYTGLTTIAAGTLKLGSTTALGTTAGATSVTSGAVLDLNGINYSGAEVLTLAGTGISSGGCLINSNSTAATYAGNITLSTTAPQITANNPITLSGIISGGNASGTNSLTVAGNSTLTGVLTVSGNNTYTGLTTINSGGLLKIGANNALGAAAPNGATDANDGNSTIINWGGVLDLNGITYTQYEGVRMNGAGFSAAGDGCIINSSSTTAVYSGCVDPWSSATLYIANPVTFNGMVQFRYGNSFTKTGSGILTLTPTGGDRTSANSILIISAGTVKLGVNLTETGSATAYTQIASGAVLDLNGFTCGRYLYLNGTGISSGGALINNSSTPATHSGSVILESASSIVGDAGTIAVTGTTTGAGFGLTLGGAMGGSVTNVISGTLTTVTKTGAGTWTLSGANTFTGGTTLGAGQLNINHATAIGSGAFTISGGIIDNTTAGSITLSNNNTQNWNGDFVFTGTQSLNMGTGDVTLSASRQITVSAGTLTSGGAINQNTLSLTKAGNGALSFVSQSIALSNLTISAGTLTATSGNLNLAGNFSNSGTFTHNNGSVTFNGTTVMSGSTTSNTFNNLSVAASSTVTSSTGITGLVVNGTLTTGASAVLDLGTTTLLSGTLGTISNSGTIKTFVVTATSAVPFPSNKNWGSAGTVEYAAATGAQTIMLGTYNSLKLSNTSGTNTITGNVTINGIFTLTGGTATTGIYLISITSTGSVSRTGGHVIGNFKKHVATGPTSKTFEIGDATNYTPVTVAFANVTTADYLTASTVAGDNGNIATSSINLALTANRNWTLTNQSIVFSTYNVTFTFVAGDLDGAATPGNFSVGRYSAGWTYPTVGSKTSTTTEATGLAAFGDFQLGEIYSLKTWDGGAGTNNWGDAANWNTDGVPASTDDVDLTGANTININVAATAKNLLLNNAGLVLTINAGNTLAISGNLTLTAGTFNTAAAFATVSGTVDVAGGTVGFTGSGTQTIPAYNYNNLTSSSTGGRTLAGSGTIGIAGTFTPGTNLYTITGSTIAYNAAGAQTIAAFNYNNLTLSNSGVKTFAAGTSGIASALSITGSATANATTNSSVISYNGSANQTITVLTYYGLNISSTGGTVTGINTTVTDFSINSGTVDLNTFTLAITGTATYTAGTINNGTVTSTGAATTFGGTVFGAVVNATSNSLALNGSVFNNVATLTKNGATPITSTGGNTFNSTATITNSGSANFILANATPDTFNGNVVFTNTGTSGLYVAYNSTGNLFAGNVTFNNTGTASNILSSYSAPATAAYNGNIVVNNTSSGGISFGTNGGATTLATTKTITIGGTGFTTGTLLLRNFTQSGSTVQSLTLTGTARLQIGPSATFNGNVTVVSPQVLLHGCTYNGTASITKNGVTNNLGNGGNTFNGTTTLVNSNNSYFATGFTTADIFNADLTLTNTGNGFMAVADEAAGTMFNGDITVNSTNGAANAGVVFGNGPGTAVTSTLAAGKTISVGGTGFTAGRLLLRRFIQSGATAQSFTLAGTSILYLGLNSTFNGSVNFVSPQLFLNGCVFNGTASLTKSGSTDNASSGGNIFNGVTTLVCSGGGSLDIASSIPEQFNADLTVNITGTSRIQIGLSSAGNIFNGNVTINHGGNTGGLNTIMCRNSGSTATINGNLVLNCTNSQATSGIVVGNDGQVTVNGNITVSSTSGRGILFAAAAGSVTLGNGYTITDAGAGSFTTGTLTLRQFTQTGSTAQNIALTGTANLLVGSATIFNGPVNFSAPQLYLSGCQYNNTAVLTKNGATDNTSAGSNIFNGATTITNSGTGFLRLAYGDDFNSDATFIQTGSGLLQPAYAINCTIAGNLSTAGTSTAISFGTGTGSVTLNGTGAQLITGSLVPTFRNLTIANTGNTVTTDVNTSILGNLTVTSGTFDLGSFTANRLTSGGTLTVSNGATLKIGSTNTIPSNYSAHSIGATSTIEYSGANQAVAILNSSQNYGHLAVSGSGTEIISGDVTVRNNLSITAGSLDINTYTLKIGGSITNSGTFTASDGTIEMNGTSSQIIPAATFSGNTIQGLTVNNTAGVTLAGALALTDVLTVSSGSLAADGYLTLKSTATATARVAAITSVAATPISGNVITERYVPGRRKYRLITSPVTTSPGSTLIAGQESLSIWGNWQNGGVNTTPNIGNHITGGSAADGFDQGTNNASLFTYNDVNRLYTGFTTANGKNTKYTPLKAGVAYLMFVYGDRLNSYSAGSPHNTVLVSTGTLLTGNQVYNTGSAIPLSGVTGRFTLLGNPFASPINWATIPKTDLENTYWGWDPNLASTGGYITVNTTGTVTLQAPYSGSTGLNQYIQPGQGFFVKTTGASPVLTIREQDKSATFNANAFRTNGATVNDISLLAINLQYVSGGNTILTDGVLAAFDPSFADSAGPEDASKMANSAESMAILNNTTSLSIDARQMPQNNDTLFLNVTRLTRPQYKLQIFTQQMESAGIQPFLEDRYLNTITQLSLTDTNSIVFNVSAGVPASADINRFRIVFHSVSVVLPISNIAIKATLKDKDIQVDWEVAEDADIKKYEIHRSVDGVHFTLIAEVTAKGNNGSENYQWLDMHPTTGNNYYQVRAIPMDGRPFVSKIVVVNMKVETVNTNAGNTFITVYPNPAKNKQINIRSAELEKGKYILLLHNPLGQQIIRRIIDHPGGSFSMVIYSGKIQLTGMYFLQMADEKLKYSQTVFIE